MGRPCSINLRKQRHRCRLTADMWLARFSAAASARSGYHLYFFTVNVTKISAVEMEIFVWRWNDDDDDNKWWCLIVVTRTATSSNSMSRCLITDGNDISWIYHLAQQHQSRSLTLGVQKHYALFSSITSPDVGQFSKYSQYSKVFVKMSRNILDTSLHYLAKCMCPKIAMPKEQKSKRPCKP